MPFLESLGIDQSYVYVMVMFVAIFLFICSLIKNNIVRAVVALGNAYAHLNDLEGC